MPLMVPEAFAAQDNGDFKLEYDRTNKYTNYKEWIESTGYFESQIEGLNDYFMLPYDVPVRIEECGEDSHWSPLYDPTEKEIIYCYEAFVFIYEMMDVLRLHGWEYAPNIFCKPVEPNCTKFNPTVEHRTLNVIDSFFLS